MLLYYPYKLFNLIFYATLGLKIITKKGNAMNSHKLQIENSQGLQLSAFLDILINGQILAKIVSIFRRYINLKSSSRRIFTLTDYVTI